MVLNPIADTDYFDEHGCLEKKAVIYCLQWDSIRDRLR